MLTGSPGKRAVGAPGAGRRAGGKVSITESIQREVRRVITASELASRLGPTKGGVRVLFIGLGEDVYELELPYIGLSKSRSRSCRPSGPVRHRQKDAERASDEKNPEASPPPSRLSKDLADRIRERRY